MKAQRWIAGIVGGLLIAGVSGARAQGVGLQVADTAELRTAGETEFAVGGVLSKNVSSCAARLTYAVEDEFRAFFDLGWYDPDACEGNISVQAGGIMSLPVEFYTDLGLRAAGYYVDTDAYSVLGGSLMLLSSGETLLDDLYLYGGLGVDFSKRSLDVTMEQSSSRSELNPALTIGLSYAFTTHFSAYVEASHVDEAMIGAGVRYR